MVFGCIYEINYDFTMFFVEDGFPVKSSDEYTILSNYREWCYDYDRINIKYEGYREVDKEDLEKEFNFVVR